MADLENGLFSGENPKQNTADPTIDYRFVTAIVKVRTLLVRIGACKDELPTIRCPD